MLILKNYSIIGEFIYMIATLLLLACICLIGIVIDKRLGILSLYGGIWFIVIFLCGIQAYGLKDYSDKVYLMVGIACFSFSCAYIFSQKIMRNSFKVTIGRKKVRYDMDLNYNVIVMLLLFSAIFYFIQSIKVIILLRQGIQLSVVRYSYFTQGKIMNEFETIISSWVTTPLVYYLLIPLNACNLLENEGKGKKMILILSVIDALLYLFVTQAKQNLIYYIFSLICTLITFQISKKQRVRIYKLLGIILIIIIVANAIRSNSFTLSFLYTYIGTSMNMLDYWTSFIDSANYNKGNGLAFLYGVLNIPYSVISNILGKNNVTLDTIETNLSYIISTGIEVFKGAGKRNNVFVTYLTFLYYDARYLGIVVGNLVYGYFIGALVSRYNKNSNSLYAKVWFNIIAVGVMYTFVSWPFYNTAYCISFILLRLCFKKTINNKNP